MDDMVFHNNNKNAIYVLNSNYNSYGELGRSNIFGSSKFNDMLPTSMDCQPLRKSSLTQKPNPAKYSTENFSSSCSPATSAIQKLFNCSSINNSGSGHNNSYINNNNNNYNNNNNLNNNNNHNNSNRNNHKNSNSTSHLNELGQPKLTTLGSSSKSYHNHHSNGTTTNHIGGVTICASSGIGAMKKGPPIKSTLIAKKTKFWKCLEEEKWRKLSIEHLSTTNCERNSCNTSTSPNTSSMISIQPTISNSESKNKQQQPFDELSSNNEHNSIPIANTYNWSRNDDNNKNQKSTSELYKEAAQLLGLSCTLCDNCRCLDCQSRYFECDDSDSFSEISFMDDYYDEMATMSECHDFQSMEYNGDVNNDIIIEPHQFINEGAIGHDEQNQMPSGSADANDDTHINDVDDDYDETYEDGDDYNNTEYGDSPERQQQHERCDIEQHYNCQSLKFNGQHNITNGPIEVNNCKIANDVCSENSKLVLATEK